MVHAFPGTNHVLISGEQSLDSNRHRQCINTIMYNLAHDSIDDQCTDPSPEAHTSTGLMPTSSLRNNLPQDPYCFIADTDSIHYAIDTAANSIIVNDVNHITDLILTSNRIKEIGINSV